MESSESVGERLNASIKMLSLSCKNVEKTVSRNKEREIEKLLRTLEEQSDEIENLKIRIQTLMFNENKGEEEVGEYGDNIDKKLERFIEQIDILQAARDDLKREEAQRTRRKFEEEEEIRIQSRYDEEKRIEEMRQQMRSACDIVNNSGSLNESGSEVKPVEPRVNLPKLVITKFQGTHLDWLRFWGQFQVEIDSSDISPVSKFSYLKELLIPRVRLAVDGLPFTTEGYYRAKDILQSKYGRPSEVANAHMQTIIALPTIHQVHLWKIHDFYEKLTTNVQSLDTMGKLSEIKGHVRLTLDKLQCIRADLVRTDDNWQDWDFQDLTEALRKWTDRNPINSNFSLQKSQNDGQNFAQTHKREKLLRTFQTDPRNCVFCDKNDHKPAQCTRVVSIEERRKIFSSKKLCFNCAGRLHRASDCRSKHRCQHCDGRHHTSICDKKAETTPSLSVSEENVIYPVVMVKVNGIRCRALLDTGSGSSYASSSLIDKINQKPARTVTKQIEMMLHVSTKKINVYSVEISDVGEKFKLRAEVSEIEKSVLLSLPNPNSTKITQMFRHLKNIRIDDVDTKDQLPIHLIIGASEYAKIKTSTAPKIGKPGEPVAELTKFGWTIISPGQEIDLNQLYVTRSSSQDYEDLCKLDVLGLEDRENSLTDPVFDRFKKQLTRSPEGWYETNLLWKTDVIPGVNKFGSLGRLRNLLRKLEKEPKLFQNYDQIIQNQVREGIVEKVMSDPVGKEFYLPHRPVIRHNAETTKVRIVCDASAKEKGLKSLNDVLETGPPLQNLLWDILLRCRVRPVMLCADMKQAFLQIRVRQKDRDSLRFHWVENKDPEQVEVFRYTRPIFGLVQSPFILNGTVKIHLDATKEKFPEKREMLEKIQDDIYVDDVASGGNSVKKVIELKETLKETFQAAGFELHKWHSNKKILENVSDLEEHFTEDSYAKQMLGVKKDNETKILGLSWDKIRDYIGVEISKGEVEMTKRGFLKFLASIFDPLGILSPVTLMGKLFYREACELQVSWDKKLPEELVKRFSKWFSALPEKCEVHRSMAKFEEYINSIDLHVFCDASIKGVSAALYVVVNQKSETAKGLLASKSRLAKKNQTIPRLELIAVHMGANLMENAKEALKKYPVRNCYGWTDSTVVLHWLKKEVTYKQFVSNRISKVKEKNYIYWMHVPTKENPADYGSRGCTADRLPVTWFDGPQWLLEKDDWPEDIVTKSTDETDAEIKQIKSVLSAAVVENKNDLFYPLMEKYDLWKFLRIMSWVSRFLKNCKKVNLSGALTTDEINDQWLFFINQAQREYEQTDKFKEDQLSLNLQRNERGVYECRGRIQGFYPLYLPSSHMLSERIVFQAHLRTLHGGVGLTMVEVRKRFWIPKLRQLVKRVRHHCHGCKRFHTTAFEKPPPGNLPTDRVEGTRAFEVIGVDFAGPIVYKNKNKREGNAFILLFTCSLSRAVHLELLTDQTAVSFIKCLKRFVARRGRPAKIYSDNAMAFKKVAKWLYEVMRSEKLNNFMARQDIRWQFNLSRAPWWGGQFERLVGVVKQSLYKTIRKTYLTFDELEEVLLDVEQTLNNRPLSYVEDDVQLPVLTPNTLILGQCNLIPTVEESHMIEKGDLRKRFRYVQRCKDSAWSRWTQEYLKGLRERHNLKHNGKHSEINIGDVVIIKSDEKNRGRWKIGVISNVFPGIDGIIRAVELRTGKGTLQRPVQYLYPLELTCDIETNTEKPYREGVDKAIDTSDLKVDAKEFRPRRSAAEVANIMIKDQCELLEDI